MKIIEAYKVSEVPVSPNIYNLPCIDGVWKGNNGKPMYFTRDGINRRHVFPGDWICKDNSGQWQVLTDEEYNAIRSLEK